jgi:phosphate transport system permease protein
MNEPEIDLRGASDYKDRAFAKMTAGAAGVVLLILGLIAMTITRRSLPVFHEMGLGFFTTKRWSPPDSLFGALPFVWGTVFTAAIALLIAVPISLGVALFMTQVAPPRLGKPLVYLIDLLAGVPSVVFGLWGVLVLSQHFDLGRSFLTAGIILAIMIIPIITSLSREVIATVPAIDREGAYALGATRWEMIRGAVWPHSQSGIVGAVLLGLGRAMGETIAAALVIGSSPQITSHLFAPGYSMPSVIADQFGEASGVFRAALIGLGVLLFALTIIINIIARSVVARSTRRSRGA